MRLPQRKNIVAIGIALLSIPGLFFNGWPAVKNWREGGVDFNQFYSAGRLVGTGHLYDFDALFKLEAPRGPGCPTGRLPIVLYGHKVLGVLPYQTARLAWLALNLAALLVFALFWPGARPLITGVAMAWSMSPTMAILFGQDLPLWMMFFTLGLVLLGKDRPWSAGFAFSLCICKYHLAVGVPVMLVAQKRWKTLIAGATACFVWLAVCFLIEGPRWPVEYLKATRMPEMSPATARMPNLHGLTAWLPGGAAVESILILLVVFLLWRVCRSVTSIGLSGAAAAASGLLLGQHAYTVDCLLLIPLGALMMDRPAIPLWMKAWSLVMLSPVPALLLTSDQPATAQVLIIGFVIAGVMVNPEEKADPSELRSVPAIPSYQAG